MIEVQTKPHESKICRHYVACKICPTLIDPMLNKENII